jgi:hypothetical protein
MNYPNGYDPMNFSQSPQQQNTNSFSNLPSAFQSQLYYANQLTQQQAAQQQQQTLQQTPHQQQPQHQHHQHQPQYGGGNLATTGGVGVGSVMRGAMPQQQMGGEWTRSDSSFSMDSASIAIYHGKAGKHGQKCACLQFA